MNLTLSVDEEVVREVRKRAEATGTSLNQMVRDYLEDVAGMSSRQADADELKRMSLASTGNSNGWKFNREEIHERR